MASHLPAGSPTNSSAHAPVNTTEIEARTVTPAEPAEPWLTPGRFAAFLGLLIVATFPGVVSGARTFIVRDFGLFAYPLAFYQRQCFWRGELPLWNPLSHCGIPYLAQWNTITLYPGSLIYLLLPLPWSVSFFCLAHLFWGGLGMYFLAVRWTNHRLAAALAGVIFCFNGLALNFLMWTNVSATYGWLPWVLILVPLGWGEGGRKLVWATLASAMQLLAGSPEVFLLTWFILFLLACGEWCRHEQPRRDLVLRFCGIVLLVAVICAAQLLPFLELLSRSQRDTGYSSSSHDWSMPIWGWANFLVPLFRASPTAQGVFFQNGQYWTSSYYAGIGTVFLALLTLWRLRDWRVGLLASLVFVCLVLAWGDTSILYRGLLSCFPALGFVRYPIKSVILVLALAPLLAAMGLAALAARRQRLASLEIGCALALLLLIAIIIGVEWKNSLPGDTWRATWQSGLTRALFLLLIVALLDTILRSRGRWRTLLSFVLLVCFWLDLVTHMPRQNPAVPPSVYSPGWAGEHLKWTAEPCLGRSRAMLSPEALRVLRYNPLSDLEATYLRNRLAARSDCNLLDGIPQIDGFFSLTPREIFKTTMLPYDAPASNFTALLDFLAVSQRTTPGTLSDWTQRRTAMPFITAGQQPVFADDETVVAAFSKTNTDFREAVFLPLEARHAISATRQPAARVLAAKFTNQRISFQIEAPAPSLVVISQSWYPAWEALVDGHPAKLWRANYAFQALEVPAGKHDVRLVYADNRFLAGVVSSSVGLLACLTLWLLSHFRATPVADRPGTAPQTTSASGKAQPQLSEIPPASLQGKEPVC